mmetsp:Transcript_29434/g.78142  ORF Transcript_29434/g.78142 Transcript_29434/m.78142 type:complete len:226 (-) Transcript_29434:142-819(-)
MPCARVGCRSIRTAASTACRTAMSSCASPSSPAASRARHLSRSPATLPTSSRPSSAHGRRGRQRSFTRPPPRRATTPCTCACSDRRRVSVRRRSSGSARRRRRLCSTLRCPSIDTKERAVMSAGNLGRTQTAAGLRAQAEEVAASHIATIYYIVAESIVASCKCKAPKRTRRTRRRRASRRHLARHTGGCGYPPLRERHARRQRRASTAPLLHGEKPTGKHSLHA